MGVGGRLLAIRSLLLLMLVLLVVLGHMRCWMSRRREVVRRRRRWRWRWVVSMMMMVTVVVRCWRDIPPTIWFHYPKV